MILAITLLIWSGVGVAQVCTPDAVAPHASTTVIYGHPGSVAQATIITPSSDGTVRAIDASTRESLWTFTPPEISTAHSRNGLLTGIRILRFDANDDGAIDISDGDKVWLYFGLRRAGAAYYALDITERSRPRVLWQVDATSLEGLADAWSTPAIARVRIAGAAQNGEHFVVIFGGGHSALSTGNRIFMLDAATGRLLWNAGAAGEAGMRTPDLVLTDMRHPIPAGIAVLDTNGDEFADRMYAIDLSGHFWRFDIWNGHARGTLVTGGMLADLTDPLRAAAGSDRMFFNTPDVALIQPRGAAPYYNVSAGSGDVAAGTRAVAAGPSDAASAATSLSRDYFYSVRDREPFDARSQASYDRTAPILAADLADISTSLDSSLLPPDASGWRIDLGAFGRPGERVVAESVTLNGVVLFTTFQPSPASDPCNVSGSTRVYAVRVDVGRVGADLNGDGRITRDDISIAVPDTEAPGAVRVRMGAGLNDGGAIRSPDAGGSESDSGSGADAGSGATRHQVTSPECLVGATLLKTCVAADALLRTYWQRPAVN